MTAGFLASLPADERRALEASGRERRYAKGETLMREGEAVDSVLLVRRGWVKVVAVTADGHETVLSVRGPGDILGELEAIDPRGARSATVVALEPIECRVLTGDEFRAFVAAHGATGLALLRVQIRRLRAADRRRAEFGSYSAARRLARVLVELVAEHGHPAAEGVELGLELSQDELGGLTASSRESVSRALGALRSQGLISTARRRLTVHDIAALREYAG